MGNTEAAGRCDVSEGDIGAEIVFDEGNNAAQAEGEHHTGLCAADD
jgi:hypothetical protein